MALGILQPGQALGILRVVGCSLPATTFAATAAAATLDATPTVAI